MASFMDYYNEELRKTSAPRSAAPAPKTPLPNLTGAQKKEETNPIASAGNWLLDIISRPLYGMTNMNKENIDRAAQGFKKFDDGDPVGGVVDLIAGAPSMPSFLAGPGGSPALSAFKELAGNSSDKSYLEGLTSNDTEKKRTNSQLIEYISDKQGETDPNYKDVQDNVNPWFKGTVGFTADVFGDPLTYLSGTGLVKGATAIGRGVNAGLDAASEAVSGARGVAGASTRASRAAAAAKSARQTEKAAAKNAGKADKTKAKAARDEEAEFYNVFDDVANNLPPTRAAAGANAGKNAGSALPDDLADLFKPLSSDVPLIPMSRAIEAPKPAAVGAAASASGRASRQAEPAPMPALADDVLDETGAIPMGGSSLDELLAKSPARASITEALRQVDDLVQTGTPAFQGSRWIAEQGDSVKVAANLVGDGVQNTYTVKQLANIAIANKGTPRGDQARILVQSEIGKAKASAAQGLSRPEALRQFLNSEDEAIEALGAPLYDYLTSAKVMGAKDKKIDKTIDQIRQVVAPDAAVMDVFRNIDQNLADALSRTLGVPRAAKMRTEEEAAGLARRMLDKNDPYNSQLAKGLARALGDELEDLVGKGYVHSLTTKNGMKVARTSEKAGEGLGRYVDQLNGFSQYTVLRHQKDAIEMASLDIMRARGIKGNSVNDLYSVQRTQVYKEAMLRVMDDSARLLDDLGAHMSIGVGSNTTMLSTAEVYRSVMASAKELGLVKTIDQGLFNYGTAVAPTALTDAAAAASRGGTWDEILAILTEPKKYGNKGLVPGRTGQRPNNLIDSAHGWGFVGKTQAEATKKARALAAELKIPNADLKNMIRTKKPGQTSKASGQVRRGYHAYVKYTTGGKNYMAEALATALVRSSDELATRAAQNEARFAARSAQESHKLATKEINTVDSFLKDSSGVMAKITAMRASNARIAAEAAKINAGADSVKVAEDLVEASVGKELTSATAAMGTAQGRLSGEASQAARESASDTFAGSTWRSVDDDYAARPTADDIADPGVKTDGFRRPTDESTPLAGDWRDMTFDSAADWLLAAEKASTKAAKKGGPKGPVKDISEDIPGMVDAFGQKIIDPYGIMKHKVNQWFNQNAGANNVMRLSHAWQNSMSMRTSYVSFQLNAIHHAARKVSLDKNFLANRFAAIQRGETYAGTDAAVGQIDDMIQGVLKDFFDLKATGSMGNVFLRTTERPELINAMLKEKGIDEIFDIGAARAKVAESGGKLRFDEALAGQWKDWKISDPLDFMKRMSTAREGLAFNRGVGMSFKEMAASKGAYSAKPAKGYVRIQAANDSRFAAHIPKGYYKKELAQEMQRVEQVLRTGRGFQGELGSFVKNTYGPLLNAWKFSVTLPRPGHHVRNLIGDTSVTWMRRGNQHFASSWKDAVKVMGVRKTYPDVDMLAAAERFNLGSLPKGGDTIVTSGKHQFSSDEIYSALAERGALPTYNTSEDFVETAGRFNDILGKISLKDTKVGAAAGALSQGRDHLSRIQHMIQALRQDGKTWKGTKAELLEKVSREVIKYHPDASLLTTMESKLRLAIPFYSWFGKIMPALVESLVMHPGRLSNINKAGYNFQVGMGIDPESLSDPFPDDQLFPSFITNNVGGPAFTGENSLFGLMGADENTYIRSNPGIAHLDVLNTFGGDPFRGILGMTSPILRAPFELATGGTMNTGARINDVSDYIDQSIPGVNYLANISGYSPTGSVGSLLSGEGLDEQYQVGRGNKTDFDKALSVANWITGMGFQNLSRPNYINYAEIERRNAAGDK